MHTLSFLFWIHLSAIFGLKKHYELQDLRVFVVVVAIVLNKLPRHYKVKLNPKTFGFGSS